MGGVSRGSPEGGCGGGGNPAAADNDVGGGGKRTAKQGRLIESNFEVLCDACFCLRGCVNSGFLSRET